jgi:FkbM family methyltransferase
MNILMRKAVMALTPRNRLLKSTLSNGAIVYGKNLAGFGGRGVYIYRDSIEPELEFLEKFLDSEGVFIDVGSNTGIYTLKAAKHFGDKGVVLALEPFPDVLATLFYSIQINGFTNIRLRNFCAGEKTGTAKLWMNMGHPNSFSLVNRDDKASCLSTLTVALDDLFAWEELSRLDYLKIDAEGAEQQVLAGGKMIIEKYRPIIQLEVIISEIGLSLANYSVFRAPGSPNIVYIPNESSKVHLPKQLGWEQI